MDNSVVQHYKLPCNEISIAPMKRAFEIDSANALKVCPKLKQNVISPSHFDKMSVSLSIALLHSDVAADILYYIGEKNMDEKHKTTTWLIRVFFKWFKLMTSRYHKLALSYRNKDEYDESISFL